MRGARWALVGGAGACALAAALLLGGAGPFRREVRQPIPFPHDLHAGTNRIPCMYCHSTADRSPDAGIPSVATCAGCHLPGGVPLVRADRPGVQQLAGYWQRREPIPWVRIYDLPDHVHFPHMIHVNAGLQCQQCHGPVETMREVRRAVPLQMGWCLDCHHARQARVDCAVCHY